MHPDVHIDIPDVPGLITKKVVKGVTYMYYEYGRTYSKEKKYTSVQRACIGKIDADGKMIPNANCRKYLPQFLPGEAQRERVSSCLRTGAFLVLRRIVDERRLVECLLRPFTPKDAALVLDIAFYSLITEGNTAQHYPDYTYNHPVFTEGMRRYSDSKVSEFLQSMKPEQINGFLHVWNLYREKSDRIYISYDSTNKNCQAGDIAMVEYGHAKDNRSRPIFNYAIAFDQTNSEPLFYEEYPGSIVDVSQLQFMLSKAEGFDYRNVGVILDRGYFSRANVAYMDAHGIEFVIMAKGLTRIARELVEGVRGTFEDDRDCFVREYKAYGTTVRRKLYDDDSRERYFHIFYGNERQAHERTVLEDRLEKLNRYLEGLENTEAQIPDVVSEYFELVYDKKGTFLYANERKDVIRREIRLCGYFVLITSEEMSAVEALRLYKGRDATEKLFRGDKSYLGNASLRVCSESAVAAKIFIEFVALIIRNRLHNYLSNAKLKNEKKANFMNVPSAIRELEKIEMIRRGDGIYTLDHAVTATQKEILRAMGLDERFIIGEVEELSKAIQKVESEAVKNGEG
ncbi:Transposase [Fibrobacter sp. UWH5]|uniref:IS1634 family transposase n=1 Tax=Fibrobacter sp. UWH5 TaxID=1896211 RepID=UPI00091831DE|nr:transposase [Fibrobacter sp. UWH5]SHL93353.1 Transposase [Fibrobacter sp. UWH5]